jgi:A/G-specific adenine glycosylase
MELGALVCTPRQPRCTDCPVATGCFAFKHGCVEKFPNTPRRPPATARRFAAFVVRRGNRFLVRQRPAGGVNAHLWEFPNREVAQSGEDLIHAAGTVVGAKPDRLEHLGTIKHSITRYRMTLDVFGAVGVGKPGLVGGRWLERSQLRQLPFSSAHKRILRWLPAV